MFMSTTGGPFFAFVAICFAAIGFKAASALFWPIPQSYLDARIAAAVIALINSIGNLGGFVAPTAFGILEETTGSIEGDVMALLDPERAAGGYEARECEARPLMIEIHEHYFARRLYDLG